VAQSAGGALGTFTVVVAAVLARRLVDDRTALVAAVLVALSPVLVAADGSLVSEALFVPLVTSSVLAALLAGRSGACEHGRSPACRLWDRRPGTERA